MIDRSAVFAVLAALLLAGGDGLLCDGHGGTTNLFIYEAASGQARHILPGTEQAAPGTPVEKLGASNSTENWLLIRYISLVGWVRSDYLS